MVQKLFVSDLDGTLLDNKKEIPKNCIEIIQKIKQMDGIFCIATGRMWSDAKKYYDLLKLDTACITDNGARMVNPSNKYFIPNTYSMSNKVFYKLWNNLELQNEVEYFIIKTATNCYTSKIPKSKDLKKQFFNLFHIDLSTSKDVGKDVLLRTENRNSDMLGIILVLKESHSLTSVIREIKSVTNHIDITKWSLLDNAISSKIKERVILELNNRSAGKLNAIKIIQDYYDIKDEDVYVFGDGENDVKMLDYYSHSIAVENATYSAKIKAKYISRFNNEQGAVGKELENIFKWSK